MADPSMMVPEDEMVEQGPGVNMLLKIVILGVIGVVSVCGNIIAFGTVCFHRQLHTPIYIVIGGVALADIIVTVVTVPEEILTHADKGDLKSDVYCKVFGFLNNTCLYIAAFHLVFLSVLRGILLVVRAHHGPTKIHALITCILLWVATMLANIPMIDGAILDPFVKMCVVRPGNSADGLHYDLGAEERYLLLSAAFSYFLPLLLIVIIYLSTGYMSQRFFEDSYSPRERRMAKMISSLIVTFALCHLPSEMVGLLWFYQIKDNSVKEIMAETNLPKHRVWIEVRQYLSILSNIDMALRPIVYATMSREFGVVFNRVIDCKYCKQEEEEEVAPRLRRRGQEIQTVMQSPGNQHCVINPEEMENFVQDEDPEEIM